MSATLRRSSFRRSRHRHCTDEIAGGKWIQTKAAIRFIETLMHRLCRLEVISTSVLAGNGLPSGMVALIPKACEYTGTELVYSERNRYCEMTF
jgi:hypothetical protein